MAAGIQTEENIETLTNMGMEGQYGGSVVQPTRPACPADLVLRWGIDVGYATRVPFKVSHYSHMNNFFGKLDGYPNTTVLLGLNIDRTEQTLRHLR